MPKEKVNTSIERTRLFKLDRYIQKLNERLKREGKKKTNRSEFLIESAELRIESEKRKYKPIRKDKE